MRMDSEMIGILLSDSMHYTIVVSLEMSDEPNILLTFAHRKKKMTSTPYNVRSRFF